MTFSSSIIHLIGIGGSGMSAIAHVLLGRGVPVSGSDQNASPVTDELVERGARIYIGHAADQVGSAAVVVRSSAVSDDNPEVSEARARGIPVLKRADYLGQLMLDDRGIAVTGTHGKTTTTGLIAESFVRLGLDPSVIVGGIVPLLKSNGRAGHGPHFIIEADEYDRMFLGLRPQIGVVTNVEYDHPDIYHTEDDYMAAYRQFVDQLPDGGWLIASADDPGARTLLEGAGERLNRIGFGLTDLDSLPPGVIRLAGRDVRPNEMGGSDFSVEWNAGILGQARLSIPGRHNVSNALAALAAGLVEGLAFDDLAGNLPLFSGMGRRFEVKGEVAGVTIVDDYAHHPTEIAATLAAARERFGERRLWAVWQPHTFSRTRLFLNAFQNCFGDADAVVVLNIYRSRENDTLGLVPEDLASSIEHSNVHYAQDFKAAVDLLQTHLRPGDVVITLNAGDASQIGERLLAKKKLLIEKWFKETIQRQALKMTT